MHPFINSNGTPGMEQSDMTQNPFSPTSRKYMMSGAPLLIKNRVPIEITNPVDWGVASPSDRPNNLRIIIAARSAVALPIVNNHVLLICVDGIEQDTNGNLVGEGSCYVPKLLYYGLTTKDLTQFV